MTREYPAQRPAQGASALLALALCISLTGVSAAQGDASFGGTSGTGGGSMSSPSGGMGGSMAPGSSLESTPPGASGYGGSMSPSGTSSGMGADTGWGSGAAAGDTSNQAAQGNWFQRSWHNVSENFPLTPSKINARIRGEDPKKAQAVQLQPGQQLVTWPDGTQVVVDQNGGVVSTAAESGTAQNSSAITMAMGTPLYNLQSQGAAGTAPPGQVYAFQGGQVRRLGEQEEQKAGSGAQPVCPPGAGAASTSTGGAMATGDSGVESQGQVRGGELSPGSILIDEKGRRISMNRRGRIITNTDTPISLVPGWSEGSTLTSEFSMDTPVFRRVFGLGVEDQTGRRDSEAGGRKGRPLIIPPNASLVIAPPGTTVAAATTGVGTSVASGAASTTLSDSDLALVRSYVSSRLQSANLSLAQFAFLTPEQQQLVLSGQAVGAPITPVAEEPVPPALLASLQPNQQVSPALLSQYGVPLPASLEQNLSPLPAGYRRVMVGNRLVLLDPSLRVADVAVI